MNASRQLLLAALAAATLIAVPAQAAGPAKKFKCWTNADGVRECGETVPPEFAQQGHEVLNKSGKVLDEKDRVKTEEELAEAARIAAEEKARKEQEQEARRQDTMLLATFTKIEDIERVRDDQIVAIDATIKVTEARNDKIRQDLEKRVAAAAAEERAGKTPNADLLKDVESLRRQIANNEEFIAEKQGERQQIRDEYAQRIERFKELKAAGR